MGNLAFRLASFVLLWILTTFQLTHTAAENVYFEAAVFDGNDKVFESVLLKQIGRCLVDCEGRYNVLSVEVGNRGHVARLVRCQKPLGTLVTVISIGHTGVAYSPYSWRDYRLFSQVGQSTPTSNACGVFTNPTNIAGFDHCLPSDSDSRLWTYLLPHQHISTATSFCMARRPNYQRSYSQAFGFSSLADSDFMEIVTSTPTITYETYPDEISTVIPGSLKSLGYISRISTKSGRGTFYFIPKYPITCGDAVTVFARTSEQTKRTIRCRESSPHPTEFSPGDTEPSILLAVEKINANQDCSIRVAIGGIDRFTNQFDLFRYCLEFEDGSKLEGEQAAKRAAFVTWPTHVNLRNALVKVSGGVSDIQGTWHEVRSSILTVKSVDQFFAPSTSFTFEKLGCAETLNKPSGHIFIAPTK
jgi:hypothetical protein